MPSRHDLWTDYRKHFVKTSLERGLSHAVICERLGVTPASLTNAINRYGLNRRDKSDEAPRG